MLTHSLFSPQCHSFWNQIQVCQERYSICTVKKKQQTILRGRQNFEFCPCSTLTFKLKYCSSGAVIKKTHQCSYGSCHSIQNSHNPLPLCMLDLIPSHSARGAVIYGDMSTHFITQHSHRVSLCEEAKKQRKHKRQMGLIIMRTCITSSLLLRSSEFNSFSHFIPSSLSLFHTLCLPASLSLFLHFRPFCFAHIPSALANHSTRFKV